MNLRFPLLACGLLALGMLGACAQDASPPTGTTATPLAKLNADVTSTLAKANAAITGTTASLSAFTVADLQNALADANAQTPPDTVAAACYTALIPIAQNAANQGLLPKVPGAFSAFQKARDGVNVLKAGIPSSLNVACAPLVLDASSTLVGLAAKVGVALPAGLIPVTVP